MDWRAWIERAWPASQVAMARKVDCDIGSMSLEKKSELMREAVDQGWLPRLCVDDPRRAFLPLGTRRPTQLVGPAEDHLNMLQREAGLAFVEGDDDWRELACFSWHVYLSLFDIWPVLDEIGATQMWRNTPPFDSLIPPDTPYRVAEERPYGRFMYDTWSSVFEMERYFYNWGLRMGRWRDFCIQSKRFLVVERMPRRKRKAKNLTWTRGLGVPAPSDQTVGKYGMGRISSQFAERLGDPSDWAEASFRKPSTNWPSVWRDGLSPWLERAPSVRRVWLPEGRFDEQSVDPVLFWTTHLFSFLELGLRIEELYLFNELVSGPINWEICLPSDAWDGRLGKIANRAWRSIGTRCVTFREQRLALVWEEMGSKLATDSASEAKVLGINW